jgi:hypothetical protein
MRQIWLYVIDEANIETHGRNQPRFGGQQRKLSKVPYFMKWKNVHLDRTIRMFERDKIILPLWPGHWVVRLVMAKILCHLSMVKKENDNTRPTNMKGFPMLPYWYSSPHVLVYWKMIQYVENNPTTFNSMWICTLWAIAPFSDYGMSSKNIQHARRFYLGLGRSRDLDQKTGNPFLEIMVAI